MDSKQVLSVSQLTDSIRNALNGQFADVWVCGEITGLSRPQSGHVYLSLKDDTAQLSAVIWRTAAQRLRFEPQNGIEVLCRGYLDVYPQRGTYQLIVDAMEPLGAGALQLAFRQLHDRLQAEGLFDAMHKKTLPRMPRRVVVITSPTGAAIHDFLQVVGRRWPHLEILIFPVKVQGPEAAGEIARAVKICGEQFAFAPDVIVVTRGGGSMEDLWAFNEEQVVRAIFGCPIPVVSAVGHEIDVTLSDLVSDLRALTPSEAGEKLVPDIAEVIRHLADCRDRLDRLVRNQMHRNREQLVSIASRTSIRQPIQIVHRLAQQLDTLEEKLHRNAGRKLDAVRQRLIHSLHAIKASASQLIPEARLRMHQLAVNSNLGRPLSIVEKRRRKLDLTRQELFMVGSTIMQTRRQPISVLEGKLGAFDPSAVLGRGYSLTVDQQGKPVASCQNIEAGDTIQTWLVDGRITSRVEGSESNLKFSPHDEEEK